MKRWLVACFVVFCMTAVWGQEPEPGAPQAPAAGGFAGRGAQAAQPPEPKPYDKVITKDAKTTKGVFTVHRLKEKVYYEIPKSELDKDYLLVTQIAKTTLGVGYGGQANGTRVLRWELKGNRVLLRGVSYEIVADPKLPIARAVEDANFNPVIMAFNVEAFNKDGDPVIDVSRLFNTEVQELQFSPRRALRARGFDPSRTFIERVSTFPTNIEVEVTQTYTSPIDPTPTTGTPAPGPPNPFAGAGMRPGSASVLMHYSMVKLPEKPMMPRLFDERVGYFSVRQQDFGRDEQRAPKRTYITRWRLEKKDPTAALSEPVKPITYYVDPATPEKWRKWIKKGIEDWQPAFEAAGFKNGIVAKEAPTPEQDPEWSPEDARNSVVRWLPSTIENAVGPHVSDPRTGEILNADIQFYHNVMNLARDWYFVQVGPLDPRAKKLPLPDDLMGRLIEYVVAHEVGHTLGFQHNMKSSSLYPFEKVHDAKWLHDMGHVATLMDYSRFNYVVQPEDKVDPADLIPKIGPYDKWATHWGYAPIANANTPDGEKKTLDQWSMEQDKTPWLRFSTANSRGSDPGEETEAVGDADAIKASTLGMKNLDRVGEMLLPAASIPGEPYDDLEEMYGRLLGQWSLEMNHVAAIVGGYSSQQKTSDQNGVEFTPVPRERQAEAVKFLSQYAFTTPSFATRPDILRRFEPEGVLTRVKMAQQRTLNNLLSGPRINRLVEQEALEGNGSYHPADFLTDVRKSIWKEVDGTTVKIDAFRRNLQRSYLELINEKLNGRAPVTDDERPLFRGELRSLSQAIAAALPKTTDKETRYHLEDARDQIAKILDPKFAPPAPAAAAAFGAARRGVDDEDADPQSCWPDYAIRIPR